jgi:hypothetical protein
MLSDLHVHVAATPADEINEGMGRAYGVPEELDENDLMDGQLDKHEFETRSVATALLV